MHGKIPNKMNDAVSSSAQILEIMLFFIKAQEKIEEILSKNS
jgi:hypothetical protein